MNVTEECNTEVYSWLIDGVEHEGKDKRITAINIRLFIDQLVEPCPLNERYKQRFKCLLNVPFPSDNFHRPTHCGFGQRLLIAFAMFLVERAFASLTSEATERVRR